MYVRTALIPAADMAAKSRRTVSWAYPSPSRLGSNVPYVTPRNRSFSSPRRSDLPRVVGRDLDVNGIGAAYFVSRTRRGRSCSASNDLTMVRRTNGGIV